MLLSSISNWTCHFCHSFPEAKKEMKFRDSGLEERKEMNYCAKPGSESDQSLVPVRYVMLTLC